MNALEQTTAQLVIGTAGHIDHGKSRLVWALTGVNPDRLPEEQQRGMTIDLGFAHAAIDDCEVYFVDVPGHERFIRNMVAGATGVDAAMLVVAADDAVMPQTREHAELLSLLGVKRCVLVLSKIDLVDEAWADAVEQESRELLASVGMEPIACVRTSAHSGRGLDDLREVLCRLAHEKREADGGYDWFRLPIDRAFTIAGRGTVVTGTVSHGAVRVNDELELLPAGRRVRVRDLQSHSESRELAAGRLRLALNLAGVTREEVARGCELAAPGYLEPCTRFDAVLATLRMPGKTRRRVLRVRLHIATREVLAELRLLEPPESLALLDAPAQLRTASPIVAAWGQHFILRDESGSRTLGGGVVVRPAALAWSRKRTPSIERMQALHRGEPTARAEEVLRDAGWSGCTDARLAARAGLSNETAAAEARRVLTAQGRLHAIAVGAGAARSVVQVHASLLEALAARVVDRLAGEMRDNPRSPGVPRVAWAAWIPKVCPPRLRTSVAEWLLARGHVSDAGGFIVPKGHAGAMVADDSLLLDALLAEYDTAAFQPPAPDELKCRTPRNERRLRQLMDLALARGQLVRIAPGVFLHERRAAELVAVVARAIRERGPMTVADIRTLLNSTRKFVVPIVEYLDAAGVTRRNGDVRSLGPKAPPA